MGVRGLMSFVEENNQFFIDLKLRDTKIIIDGFALFHRLCFNSNLDLRHGGDYDAFTDVVEAFFESLSVCNIRPYVLLDGGCDFSDKKFVTLKERAKDKIQVAHSLSMGGGGSLCPLLIREVFIQVLIKLQVSFVQCFSEADRDIMTLANHWDCPVLTMDSDFCIFDLKSGFCPLSCFQWRNPSRLQGSLGFYIPARCFSLEKFCGHFGHMNKALLPLFAVLNGNDHINLPALETFFSRVDLHARTSRFKGRRHHRILGLLNWLSHFADPTEALDKVLKHLKNHERDEAKALLCSSMEEYQPSQVKLQDFFDRGTYVSPDALRQGLPEWVRTALARAQLSPFISDAMVLRRTILHTQVENVQQPSAHIISLPIRQIIYGLLLNSSNPRTVARQPLAVSELARLNKNIKKTVIHATKLPRDSFDLDELPEVSFSSRLMLLLETLNVKHRILEPVPSSLQLPIAVTCYWLQNSEPRANLHHLQALLLGMLCGQLHEIISNPDLDDLHLKNAKMVYDQFLNIKQQKLWDRRLDLETAHIFCQWQCCLQMGLYLNQLLSAPLPEPDLTRLYSGTLAHGLYQELRSSASAENLLSACPETNHLYNQLLLVVKSSVPAEHFLPTRKSKPSKMKRKKRATSGEKRMGATLETRASNRFALLTLNDLEEPFL
ncbi:protein asteroid homolog 1 [Tachyglossus aculeatus]|uniref:protein asteroid homolog 1 n=1 Tax=Tachyglossus aculeatus TaxID=9261 RepID=UPI0018F2AFBC|nr:protein asteroid homolog 1 [Tachyglossus aculeatus]